MPHVTTTASTIGCGHDPGRVGTSSTAKLKVSGAPVLVRAGVEGKTVSGCPTAPSDKTSPCASVQSVSGGLAVKLTVGGAPVVLETLSGLTDGKPLGALSAVAAQTKLRAS